MFVLIKSLTFFLPHITLYIEQFSILKILRENPCIQVKIHACPSSDMIIYFLDTGKHALHTLSWLS